MSAAIAVFIIYLAAMLVVGFATMKMSKTYEDFIIGGRSIGPLVSSFALITSYMSGYTYTAAPGLGYAGGYSALWWASGDAPGTSLSFGILGRRLRKYSELLNAITLPEFYEKRFNSPAIRLVSSIFILIMVSMHLVAQWTASGKLLSVTFNTGYFNGMLIGCVVVLVYTIMGGYLAVVYSDFIQGIIMFAGTQILFWTALSAAGGFSAFNDKLALIDPALVTPWGPGMGYYDLMAMLTPIILIIMGPFGLPHMTVRHLSLNRPSSARKAMVITAVFVVLFSFTYYLTGGLARVLVQGELADIEEAGVRLWFQILHPTLAGLLSAAAVAALMSTADAFLILLVSTVGHDLLQRFWLKGMSEARCIFISRVLVLVIAGVSFAIAIKPPALVFTIVIFVFGGMALAFGVPNLFSVYWRRTTAAGVLASMVGSIVVYVSATLAEWSPLGLHPFILGLITAVSVIVAVSLLTPPPGGESVALFDFAAAYGDLPKTVTKQASAAVAMDSRSLLGRAPSPAGFGKAPELV